MSRLECRLGSTRRTRGPVSSKQHMEDVAAFVRALNVGRVHLVGNSYGGAIVGRLALKYAELLRSVVVGEGLIAPVSAKGKAAVAAAQKDREKLRQAVGAGDLRQAAMLQYDGALGEPGAFEKLPPTDSSSCSTTPRPLALNSGKRLRSRANSWGRSPCPSS
jgi:pimeloyl-ACP methyl ester carboxylesterase